LKKLSIKALLLSLAFSVVSCGGGNSSGDVSAESASMPLVKTGVTVSFVGYDDGYYQKGETVSFTRDAATETVTDSVLGLMWQDDSSVSTDEYTFSDAVDYCDGLNMAGYADWRLPTMDELEKIRDYGTHDTVAAFDNKASSWSSTELSSGSFAWYYGRYSSAIMQFMSMNGLGDNVDSVNETHAARCVRGSTDSSNAVNQGDVVFDGKTGLMWQDDEDSNASDISWTDAIAYCESLELKGYDDWRVPNIRELRSIFDYSTKVINSAFEDASDANYWSSTLHSDDAGEESAVIVNFANSGAVTPFAITGTDNDLDGVYDTFTFDSNSSTDMNYYFMSTYPITASATGLTAFESVSPSVKCVR